LNPTRAEGPEFQEWLNHLMGPIQAACEELEGELEAEERSRCTSGGIR
jgi:hypothetical protein